MDPIAQAITDLKEDKALDLVRAEIAAGATAEKILLAGQQGMAQVGELYEKQEYYLSELIYSAAIFKQISGLVGESLKKVKETEAKKRGTVVIGTMAGDVHDLGKNIVTVLLEASGYQVADLGVDVPVEKFIEAAHETNCKVLGVSALLTTVFDRMKELVELLRSENLDEEIRVMIGGGVVDERCREFVGADFASRNAYAAVTFCNKFYA